MRSKHQDQLTFLPAEPRVSHSAHKGFDVDWMTRVVNWLSTSPESFAWYVHDGSFGRTSPEWFPAEMISGDSRTSWGNAAIGGPEGFWMFHTPEGPATAGAVCSLSEALEKVVPEECYLTPRQAANMLRRLQKYNRKPPAEVVETLTYLAGRATKHRSSSEVQSRRSSRNRAEKE